MEVIKRYDPSPSFGSPANRLSTNRTRSQVAPGTPTSVSKTDLAPGWLLKTRPESTEDGNDRPTKALGGTMSEAIADRTATSSKCAATHTGKKRLFINLHPHPKSYRHMN